VKKAKKRIQELRDLQDERARKAKLQKRREG
jgi:hypothetical protein